MMLAIFPKYQDLFPGREVPKLEEVIAKTSSKSLLKAFSFLNAKVHLQPDNLNAQEKIFWEWIGIFPEAVRNAIGRNYLTFKNSILKDGHAVVLFSSNALLRLIDYIIRHFNDLPEKPSKDVDDEMTLLEAWLVNNAVFDLEIAEGTKPEVGNLLGVMLVNQAAQYEFIARKDFVYQTLLAGAFFTFLSGNPTLSAYLQEFLNKKKVSDYKEYLRHLISIYADGYRVESFGFRVLGDEADVAAFFESLAYDLTNESFADLLKQPDPDFKLLRERPLIKDEEQGYYPVHHNFFIDKIYQGLLFDFHRNTAIQKRYSFGDFLQYLGQEFAESHLFYQHVADCFTPKKYLTAVEGNKYNGIEYSDYYVREGNNLFLFEFKNSMVNAQVKHSKDFARIKAEIIKKLVRSDRNQAKGASQLLNVIHKVAIGGFDFDDFNAKRIGRLHIYPILVYTDDFFSLDGVQRIVSEEFDQLLTDRPVKRHQVNDITLIHLQDIINIQFSVQAGRTTFKAIIQEYFAKRKAIRNKRPRTSQELLDKQLGGSFHSLVQHLVRPYADPEQLLRRMSATLGLDSNP